jgi:Tfp pilus assembly PilM family ATPase
VASASAIYIEYPRVTLVEVTGSGRKPKLKSVIVGELGEARNEDGTPITDKQAHLNKQIQQFLKQHKVKTNKLSLLVGPDGMRFRDMHLDFKDRRQIDRVLRFQVEGVLPTVPIEDVAVGYHILHEEGDGVRVLVHAAEKDYVRRRIVALEESDAIVDSADSHLSGTMNIGLLHPELAPDTPPTLWLDFAGSTAMVAIVEGGKIYTARVFVSPYLAESDAERKSAQVRSELEAAEARAREFAGEPLAEDELAPKVESSNIGEAEIADRIRSMSREELERFLGRVAVEAQRTLLRENLETTPERLVVSGLGSAGDVLADALGERLGFEDVRAIELIEPLIPTDRDGAPKIEVPDVGELSYLAGVAVKLLGRDFSGINFRVGDLAPGTLFDYAKTPLAFAATLALLVAGIMCMMAYVERNRFQGMIAELRDTSPGLGPMFERAFAAVDEDDERIRHNRIEDDPAEEISRAHQALRERQRELQGATTKDYTPPWPAEEIMAEVLRRIAAANPSYDFSLLRLAVDASSVRLEIVVSTTENQAERDARRPALPPEQRNLTEIDRMMASLRAMTRDHPDWFAAEPTMRYGRRDLRRTDPQGNMERTAEHINLNFQLNRPTARDTERS